MEANANLENSAMNVKNRAASAYKLTPRGIEEKNRITSRFLRLKLQEYEDLKAEIDALKSEVQADPQDDGN